jgi:hypothetical protein
MTCRLLINSITNPTTVFSHCDTWQYENVRVVEIPVVENFTLLIVNNLAPYYNVNIL